MIPDLTYRLTLERMHELYDDAQPNRVQPRPVPHPRHRSRVAALLRRLRHPHHP